jgi:hypothetical protein
MTNRSELSVTDEDQWIVQTEANSTHYYAKISEVFSIGTEEEGNK